MLWILMALLGIAGATGTALYMGNKGNRKSRDHDDDYDEGQEEINEEERRRRNKRNQEKQKKNEQEQEEEPVEGENVEQGNTRRRGPGYKGTPAGDSDGTEGNDDDLDDTMGDSQNDDEQIDTGRGPGDGEAPTGDTGGSDGTEGSDDALVHPMEDFQDDDEQIDTGGRTAGDGEAPTGDTSGSDDTIDGNEDEREQLSANEARKSIMRYNQNLRDSYNSKGAHDLVDEKVQSMEGIDLEGHSASEKKIHYDSMVAVVNEMWEKDLEKTMFQTTSLLQRLADGEDPNEVMKDMPAVYTFGDYVNGSEGIILETNEKYQYYHSFISEKGNEIISKMDRHDPRVQEIKEICNKCAREIRNTAQSVGDYISYVESDLATLEEMEREVDESLDEERKNGALKTLNDYKREILSDRANNGRTLDQLIDLRIAKMAENGEINIDNPQVKAQLANSLKTEWNRRAVEAANETDNLIGELDDSKDYEDVLNRVPSLKMHSWFNSPECMDFVVASYNDYLDTTYENENNDELVGENNGPKPPREVEVKKVAPNTIDAKKPQVSIDDILRYSGAGGENGYDEQNDRYLTDAEHCYAQFLSNVELDVLRHAEKSSKSLEERSLPEMKGFIDGATFKSVNDYLEKYPINPDELKNSGEFIIQEMPFRARDLFTIQYLLMLNGFQIDLDKMTKDIKAKDLKLNKNRKIVVPVKFTGRILSEEKIKSYWESKGLKGESKLAAIVREKLDLEKVNVNKNSGR